MNAQMSFDFPLDAAPIPAALAPRRRTARAAHAAEHLPTQLAFVNANGGLVAPSAPMATRRPFPAPVPKVVEAPADKGDAIRENRLWQENGWTARVLRNDGEWSVELRRDGDSEPALVAPWDLDRDLRNPKPLNYGEFITLVKSAEEAMQRQRLQLQARLHKRLTVFAQDAEWNVTLDIVPDEYEPHALLSAFGADGELVAQQRVAPDFKFSTATARTWIDGDFRQAGGDGF
ncbi:hypothetical protein [Zoogloea sp.]|uniref:hypothetical protein n=1 Tax=Zoogloea sp. TaxID=49181 RepID=UPI0035B1BBF1